MPAKSSKQQRYMGMIAHMKHPPKGSPPHDVAEEFSHKPKGGYKKGKKHGMPHKDKNGFYDP
jgi:hypothetical protein